MRSSQVPGQTTDIARLGWADFFDEDNTPAIGYDIITDSLIVVKGCDVDEEIKGIMYQYDFKTDSWVYGYQVHSVTSDRSNFTISSSGELLICNLDGDFYVWDGDAVSSDFVRIITKHYDFGNPAIKKKVYKFYLEYICPTSPNLNLSYGINQETPATEVGALSTQEDYAIVEFKPDDPIECYSIALKLDGNDEVPATFELSSIAIVYRDLGVR